MPSKNSIKKEEIDRLLERDLLDISSACRVVMYRLDIGRTTFYQRYRYLLPWQSITLRSNEKPVIRISPTRLKRSIDFLVNDPRFKTDGIVNDYDPNDPGMENFIRKYNEHMTD